MHIAVAFDRPLFVLFGPTSYKKFGKLYSNCIPLIFNLHCNDNLHEVCSVTGSKESYCIKAIKGEEVAEAIFNSLPNLKRIDKNQSLVSKYSYPKPYERDHY